MKNNQLNVVHDNDLESLLRSIGAYDAVVKGEKQCLFCGNTITFDNISSIVPHEGAVEFTCDSPECQARLVGLR